MDDIKKKETAGEPLEWELELIHKDNESRKLIFDILTQKNEIEMYAKATERQEEYVKDIKDLTHNPLSVITQHTESEREKERAKRKLNERRKLEKQFLEDEKKWERKEEDKERERHKNKTFEEDFARRKKRLIERDLNYDSDEEKRRMREAPNKYEEFKALRIKEKEFDDTMRRKENPILFIKGENNTVTDLVPLVTDIKSSKFVEPEAKTMVTVKEYEEDDIDTENNEDKPQLSLNIEAKKIMSKTTYIEHDEEFDNDPYHKKKGDNTRIEIGEETEKAIMEISQEIDLSRKEEEKRKLQQQNLNNLATSGENSKKLIELQKQIFAMIPKNLDELFKYPIKWNILFQVIFIFLFILV